MAFDLKPLEGIRTPDGWIEPFALWGRHLRYPVLTLLLDARRPLTIADILELLSTRDLFVRGTEPLRVLADALAYETRLGRVRRVSRGCYAIGPPRHESTERRHRRRLRLAMEPHTSSGPGGWAPIGRRQEVRRQNGIPRAVTHSLLGPASSRATRTGGRA